MQDRHCHGLDTIGDFFRGGIPNIGNLDTKSDGLAGHGVITVNRQFAIFNPGYREFPGVTLIIHHFDLGTHGAKLLRHIFDRIRVGQIRVMCSKTLFRRQ